jgi:hopene-associated glycosyltransferase HpnB
MKDKAAHLALGLACASLASWLGLAVMRGRFWDAATEPSSGGIPPSGEARVLEVIVPARNESASIAESVTSLLRQQFPGTCRLTLVDDGSTDSTSDLAQKAAAAAGGCIPFEIIPGRPLEISWTGKLNALETGVGQVRAARGLPDYWLFTDADIVHHAGNLAELVAKLERGNHDLVSLMVRLNCESPWEWLLVPAFVFFFRKLYPFAWSNDRARKTAAAAGGCILIRAAALERSGGLQAIAGRLIDDCALASAVKASGGSIWLGLTSRTKSVRRYESLPPLWRMVKRTAFTQLYRSYPLTALAVAGMTLLYLLPPALTFAGLIRADAPLALVAVAAWATMAALYAPTLRLYGRPPYEAFALPAAAALYTGMTVDSALDHARGRGGSWKGRTYGKPSR